MFTIKDFLPFFDLEGLKVAIGDMLNFKDIMSFFLGLTFVMSAIAILLIFLELANEKHKRKRLYEREKNSRFEQFLVEKIKFFDEYKQNLHLLLVEKDREGNLSLLFNLTVVANLFIAVYLLAVKQLLLAIIAPVLLFKFCNKVVKLMTTNTMEKIEEQLPFAIDSIIRVSTKYGDMKSIIYEASRSCEAPVKNMLENVARKMMSGNTEEVLLQFAEEYDNVWIYSLTFTLISYLEDANKADTVKNLKSLRNMLEKENNLKKTNVTDKRYAVVINYAIALFAGVGGIGNILINPNGKAFFFSTFPGLICFVGGYSLVLFTIIINIKMSKVKKK